MICANQNSNPCGSIDSQGFNAEMFSGAYMQS